MKKVQKAQLLMQVWPICELYVNPQNQAQNKRSLRILNLEGSIAIQLLTKRCGLSNSIHLLSQKENISISMYSTDIILWNLKEERESFKKL
jgi:hypothetical protein